MLDCGGTTALTQVLSGAGAEGVPELRSARYDVPFGVLTLRSIRPA